MNKIIIVLIVVFHTQAFAYFEKKISFLNMKNILDIVFEYKDKNNNTNTKNIELSKYKLNRQSITISEKKHKGCITNIKLNSPKEVIYINVIFKNSRNQEKEKEIKIASRDRFIKNNTLYICPSKRASKDYTRAKKTPSTPKAKPSKTKTVRIVQVPRKTTKKKRRKRATRTKKIPKYSNIFPITRDIKFERINNHGFDIEYFRLDDNIFINIIGCEECKYTKKILSNPKRVVIEFEYRENKNMKELNVGQNIERIQVGYHPDTGKNHLVLEVVDIDIKRVEEVYYSQFITKPSGRKKENQATFWIEVE